MQSVKQFNSYMFNESRIKKKLKKLQKYEILLQYSVFNNKYHQQLLTIVNVLIFTI